MKPFRIHATDAELTDLRDRLRRTRWPERETVPDWSQGVPLDYVRELCAYWADGYDWWAAEARLNRWPQFRTTIDGLGIHFLHVRSPHHDALPLLLTHGWPGSVAEFGKVIEPLTQPDRPADAFHVVVPSLPGYGFSDKPASSGWGIDRIASAWLELMSRLGYDRFGAQGSDWGTSITTSMARQAKDRLAGIHLVPPIAAPDPATLDSLTPAEQTALADMQRRQATEDGYTAEQSTKPQTVGYGLVDSPAALCAWLVEKFWTWTDHDGHLETVLSKDDLLDNLMLYWLPGTGASAARLYWESIRQVQRWYSEAEPDPVTVPTGCTIFPKEVPRPSLRWAKRRYPDIRHWHEVDRGGHFGAFEQPQIFVDEVRAVFAELR